MLKIYRGKYIFRGVLMSRKRKIELFKYLCKYNNIKTVTIL